MAASVVSDSMELTTCLKNDRTGSTMSTNLLAGPSVLTVLNLTDLRTKGLIQAETAQLKILQQERTSG